MFALISRTPATGVLPLLLVFLTSMVQAFQSTGRVTIIPRASAPAQDGDVSLRADAAMVLVPVQVSTRIGRPIVDLTREAFRIYEDGIQQTINYFVQEDAPVSVGLLFDSSASMREKKRQAVEAAAAFFRTARAEDEFFLIEFDEKPRMELPFTSDTVALSREIGRMRPFGRTSLFDAIGLALDVMKRARHERKALVILSDGGDNRSRRTYSSIKGSLLESDVQIYAMGVFAPPGEDEDSPEEAEGPGLLSNLAELTGGRLFPVTALELPTIGARIGEFLRSQYLLGYSPVDERRNGTYRRITVELADPPGASVRVMYRRGYYAPNQ